MARQASSSIGGMAGGLVGVIIIGALIATPIYIQNLASDRGRLSADTAAQIETVRRAVVNMDEHLARVTQLSSALSAFGDDPADVTISDERRKDLNEINRVLQEQERKDAERGTEIDDVRVQTGPPDARRMTAIVAEHKKMLTEARRALSDLQSASVGDQQAARSLEGARVKAILHYAAGRIEANAAAFATWQAYEQLAAAAPLVSQLLSLKQLGQAIAMSTPDEVLRGIDGRIATIDADLQQQKSKLTQMEGTIGDYKARIEALDSTSRMSRLQMAEMQARSEPVHGPMSRYAQLAESARRAEAEADALRFGTLQGGEARLASIDDLVGLEYEGGSPVVGLFTLEEVAANLREQVANLEAAQKALADQKRFYATEASGIESVTGQSVADAGKIAAGIDELLAGVETRSAEAAAAADAAVKELINAARSAGTAATAAGSWKRDAEIPDASAESAAGEFNALIRSDGHMEGSMKFLEAECAYQIATIRNEQIRLARDTHAMIARAASATDAPAPDESAERIEGWRSEALDQLAKAEKAYHAAARAFPATQATYQGRTIQGRDSVWQAQAGQAAVHLLRAALQEDATARRAEKDAAYELLKQAAEGREQSELLTPAIDMILELQANPS